MVDPPDEPCPDCDADAGQECALDCPAGGASDAEHAQDWSDAGSL